ncbi:unnamed protein product [Cyclocybe aegerita]|uniref:RNase H type-1 domain-containing protein n=1 Tax=Cyclocybe aegerita TaxID=1973307 RepID=A0A8S0WAX9_CYCAE|nr:unnamed protein product [Cyclocybe aegerita]
MRIWQQNLNKSLPAQLDLLHAANPNDYDILLLQEPHINHLGNTRANTYWTVVYPDRHLRDPKKTRSVMLINKKILTTSWIPIATQSSDITVIQIHGDFGTVRIFNIYNDCQNDNSLDSLANHLHTQEHREHPVAPLWMVWAGDFNRHHPLWDEERNNHLFTTSALEKGQKLIDLLADHWMVMVLPKDIPTLEALSTKDTTQVDNVFCSEGMAKDFDRCDMEPEWRPVCTDHFPIMSTINIQMQSNMPRPRRNFRETDWEEFRQELKKGLEKIERPREFKEGEEEAFESARRELERVVIETIEKVVPMTNPTPYAKRWWTKDLTKMRKEVWKMSHKSYRACHNQANPIHKQYWQVRNEYSQLIKDTKRDHWEEWLEGLDGEEVWTASRLVKGPGGDGGRVRVPTLEIRDGEAGQACTATTNKEKGQLFFETFFPKRSVEVEAGGETTYPRPKWKYKPVTNEQVHRAIQRLKPYKVSKEGSAPNSLFTNNRKILVLYLAPLYRATDTFKIYPAAWKATETPVLRKPGKGNYSVTGAYRPIVLTDGFARILNMCKTEDLAKMAKREGLLPANHFGGRPGHATTNSIHLVVKTIKDAWRLHQCYELQKRGVPKEHVEWVRRRNKGHTTTLVFDDYQSDPFEVEDGLDQGDPKSLILYNANILLIPVRQNGEWAFIFVDDVALVATGKDFEETHKKLKEMMERDEGVLEWATKHNCTFGIEKFQLLDAGRKKVENPLGVRKKVPMPCPTLVIRGQRIKPSTHIKFLGVNIDQELQWKEQGVAVIAKGSDWLAQFQRIAKPAGGVSFKHMRQLYLSVAIPRILYTADIFMTPGRVNGGSRRKGGGIMRAKLTSIQGQIANMIVGGMRSSPHDTAEAYTDLMPFHLMVDKVRFMAALRLATLPATHPLHTAVKSAAKRKVKRHTTPLHDLMHMYKLQPELMEKIKGVQQGPKWAPQVRIQIARSKERAEEEERKRADDDIRIYTDGSGYEGRIGGAAVLYRGGVVKRTLWHRLGKETAHTVYEGEGVGLILAMELIRKEQRRIRAVTVGVDSQAAIQAIPSTKLKPGHYLWDIFHEQIDQVRKIHNDIKITVRWTPGHIGIEGNERADGEAKKGATDGSSPKMQLPIALRKKLPTSKAAVKQHYIMRLKLKAVQKWKQTKRYARLQRFDEEMPAKAYQKLTRQLRRKQATIMYQLRTGHAPLAKHLHQIGKADSPICPNCGEHDKTVEHYLLRCSKHRRTREAMMRRAGLAASSLEALLTERKLLPHLFSYIEATGRLRAVFGRILKNQLD